MFRTIAIIALVAVVQSVPYYSRSLVETPTSRVEQHLLLSPELEESYKIQQHQIQPFSRFQYPKQQVVYYYPQRNDGQTLNLFDLRQESNLPFWQQWWNSWTGQGNEEPEDPVEETQNANMMLETFSEEPVPFLAARGPDAEAIEKGEGLQSTTKPSSEVAVENENSDIVEKSNPEVKSELPKENAPADSVESSKVQPDVQQLFVHNQQYYVVRGKPEFYGNFDATQQKATAPIFSLQQLQPIVPEDNNGNAQKIAVLNVPQQATSPSFQINVEDEKTEKQSEQNNDDKSAPETSSQVPADDQMISVSEPEKEEMPQVLEKKSVTEGKVRCNLLCHLLSIYFVYF